MKYLTLFLLLIVIILGYLVLVDYFKSRSFEEERSEIVSNLDLALTKATENGDYMCCIDPPCDMCYLGDWVFEDGRCDCDSKIAKGDWESVCPECKKGIKKEECGSSNNIPGTCIVN